MGKNQSKIALPATAAAPAAAAEEAPVLEAPAAEALEPEPELDSVLEPKIVTVDEITEVCLFYLVIESI